MAVIKHIASKNADYGESERYLIFQHNEYTQKPILDEEGHMILREEYYLDGLNSVLIVHDAIVVDEFRSITLEDVIHKIQGIYRLKIAIFRAFHRLTHVELGGIEQYALLESVGPFHLHFYSEFLAYGIGAEKI